MPKPVTTQKAEKITTAARTLTGPSAAQRPKLGSDVEGEGYYLGRHLIKDDYGSVQTSLETGLPFIHDFFMAPTFLDKKNLALHNRCLPKEPKPWGCISDYHEHPRLFFQNNAHFITELLKGNYKGEWHVPAAYILKEVQKIIKQNPYGSFARGFDTKRTPWYKTSSRRGENQYFSHNISTGEQRLFPIGCPYRDLIRYVRSIPAPTLIAT